MECPELSLTVHETVGHATDGLCPDDIDFDTIDEDDDDDDIRAERADLSRSSSLQHRNDMQIIPR